MPNAIVRPVAIVVFLHAADRKSTKHTLPISEINPASIIRSCISPTFRLRRLAAENKICSDVLLHSQPNRLLEIT